MKRIATIAAILTAIAVAPSVAAARERRSQVKPQISAQVIGVQTREGRSASGRRHGSAPLVQIGARQALRDPLRAQSPLDPLTDPSGGSEEGPTRPLFASPAQSPTMSSGRTGTRASSRPVASRSAATIAAVETTVGGSPTPLTP